MPLTRIDSAFLDLDALGGIDFDVQSGVPTLKVDATNHRVGIGINSPTQKLDVGGSVNISSGNNYLVNGSQISTANVAENGSYLYHTSARAISAVTGSALDMGSNNITTTGKILFANMYSAEGDLPSASTYHGMFAHVHGTEKAYFAHGGNWIKLLDENGGSTGSLNIDGNVSSTTQFSGFDALRIHNANGASFGITADMYFTVGTGTTNRGAAIGVQYATTTGNDLYFATNPGSITNSDTLEERLRITSAGKVGIDNNNPNAKLEVKGSTGSTGLTFRGTDSSGNTNFWVQDGGRVGVHYYPFVINQDYNDTATPSSTYFYVHGSSPFIIKSDGKVGINENDPETKLVIRDTLQSTANNHYSLIVKGDDSGTDGESAYIFLSAIDAFTRGASIGAERQSSSNNHDLIFKTSDVSAVPTERLRITFDGKVGINETSPDTKLHVRNDNSAALKVGGQGGGEYYLEIGQLGTSSSPGFNATGINTSMLFKINGSEAMRVDPSGDVGIGDNTPDSSYGTNLSVHSTATNGARLKLSDGTTGKGNLDGLDIISTGGVAYFMNRESADMSFTTGGGGSLRLTSGGNLGLGCTPGNSAGYKTLQLGDGSSSAGQLWIKNSTNSNYYNWFDGGGVNFYAQSASPLIFYTNQKEKLRVRDGTSTTFPNNPYVLNITGHSAYNSANYMAGSGLAFIGEYNSSNSQTTFALISGVKEDTTDGNYGGSLIFGVRTNNTGAVSQEKARITSTGNMGIGHKLPSAGLHIKKQGRDFGLNYFYDGYNSDTGLGGSASSSVGSQAGERTHSLILESTSTAGEDIGASIGFRGRSSSGSTLGDVTFGAIVGAKENATVTDDSGYTTQAKGYLAFYTSNSYHFNPHYGTLNNERMRISSDGDVGIGLTNPVHKLHVNGGVRGDYIETDAHAVWTQSVETGTGGESGGVILKTNPDLTSSTMSGAYLYRIRAVVKNTGTDTGATWLVYYKESAAAYQVRYISRSGDSSNHPRLRIANTNQMELYTTHSSNYPVRVVSERFYTEEPDSTLHAMGGDYHWQRSSNNLSYTDGNITTSALTANPLNLTSANGWVRSAYGAISNSTVSSLNNLLIGQNMRGYLSGTDGGNANNNFYHTVTHGGMGYNGTEYCYNGTIKFFAGTGGTTANNSFTPGLRFQIQSTIASFSDGTALSQGDSVAFHNGMRSYSNRGYVAGNSTVTCTLNVSNSQTTYLVMAGFNHYGLLSYGCTYMAFTATGTSGETTNIIEDTPTSQGGGWSVSQGSTTQLVVSKSAGSYVGGGYWFVHVIAAT